MQTTSKPSVCPDAALGRLQEGWEALPWYALRVAAMSEIAVVARLREAGVPAVAPMRTDYRRRHRRARGRVAVLMPVVGGYVFASVAPWEWTDVTATRGVRGVVGVDGLPSVMRVGGPRGLAALCRRAEAGAFDAAEHRALMRAGREFSVGDLVEICAPGAAMDGRTVEVCALDGERARVSMQMLGARREVVVAIDSLVAA